MNPLIPNAAISVVSLVNSALSSAKTAKDLAKQSSDSELKQQISEVFDAILDMKERVLELDEEVRALRVRLTEKASLKRTSEFGYYYAGEDPDPLCPRCYEDSQKLIHLPAPRPWSGGTRRDCRVCSHVYWEKPMQSQSLRVSDRGRHSWME